MDSAVSAAPASDSAHRVYGTVLAGVNVIALDPHHDSRGTFTEIYNASFRPSVAPTQWSVVRSRCDTLRGMHVHLRHDEYFHLVDGHAYVGLHDIRPGSPTRGLSSLYEFLPGHAASLVFPRGLLHGWLFTADSIHLQATSEDYVDYRVDDNFGCAWNDPALDIPWPSSPTRLSARARAFPALDELVADISRRAPEFRYESV